MKSIDSERLKEFDGLEDETGAPLLASVLKLYLEIAPDYLNKMRVAAKAQKPHEIHRAAHSLASSSANIGAVNFGKMCKDLELNTKSGSTISVSHLNTLVEQIFAEYQLVESEIRLLAKDLPAA